MLIDEESRDAITELINIGVGRAAGLLNEITDSNIRLQVPEIRIFHYRDLAGAGSTFLGEGTFSAVMQEFRGRFSGVAGLVFPKNSALQLVQILSGDDSTTSDMDAVQCETFKEVGNIIINAVMGSIANALSEPLTFSLPGYCEGNLSALTASRISHGDSSLAVVVRTRFLIESMHIEGTVLLILEMGSLERLIESIRSLETRERGGDGR